MINNFEDFAELIAQKVVNRLHVDEPKLYTIPRVATCIGRTKRAVQHLIAKGDLPAVRSGRRVHVSREDLDRWIKQNKECE